MNQNNQQLKNQLIQWINENINHPQIQGNKQKALEVINIYNWELLCEYDKDDWSKLDGPLGVGVSIYHQINKMKSSNGI